MSKNVAVFVDVANLYYAARGQDVDVDYVALLKHATKGRDLIRAYAYSGLDPENENQKKFLDFLGKNGYKVVAKDIRKFGDGRVKANLDIELVVDLFRLADRMDIAVIVSGDGDFAPAIRALQDHGVRCEVISFKPNTSSDLFAVADEFVDVMKISAIGRQKDGKGVGAPEMPAKEVNPDVGFREASPAVAAAALAAIRGNGEEAPARGRTRGRRSRAKPTTREAATPEAAAVAEVTPADRAEQAPGPGVDERRRRRRGGRGRGRRGRRGEGPETMSTTEAEPAGVRWQELDSLSELEGNGGTTPDLEFTFEEADAATLAELGLAGQPEALEGTAPAEEKPPTRTTRTRRATAKVEVETATVAAGEPAPAKPARSTSRAKAGTKATSPSTAKGSAKTSRTAAAKGTTKAQAEAKTAKPRGARTSRAKASSAPAETAEPSGAAAQDEGIWKRLTSGRGTRRQTTPSPTKES